MFQISTYQKCCIFGYYVFIVMSIQLYWLINVEDLLEIISCFSEQYPQIFIVCVNDGANFVECILQFQTQVLFLNCKVVREFTRVSKYLIFSITLSPWTFTSFVKFLPSFNISFRWKTPRLSHILVVDLGTLVQASGVRNITARRAIIRVQ